MKNSVLRRLVAVGSLLLGVPAFAQTLTWGAPRSHTFFTDVGGTTDRAGVAVTAFKGGIWIAYTSTTNCLTPSPGHTDCPVVMANNAGSGSSDAFNGGTTVPAPFLSTGIVVSSENPALTSGVVNGQETLYLAFRDSFGAEYVGKTTDGVNWSYYGLAIPQGAIYSPSMALSADGNTLYIGYMDATQNLNQVLCSTSAQAPSNPSCYDFGDYGKKKVFFNPNLAFFQGELYLGVEDRGDSHCLYFYRGIPPTTPDGFEFVNPNNSCPEQTSATPALVVHNNVLYTAFRTNDGSHKFTVRASLNGHDFTSSRQQPGFSIDGPPAMVDLNQFGDNRVLAVFSMGHTLYVSYGQ